ncbi:MAG: hypothetical protein HPY45_00085 [Anaerolineae bacterium]|nr:hypothetical protein [Anaerolineae bacterium]
MERINWKTKTLVIGALVGAVTGLIASYMIIQRAEKRQDAVQVSVGDGVKVGLGVLGLLRLISDTVASDK